MRQWKQDRRGFTMIEVMIGMTIFAIAILSLLGFYGGLANLREQDRNLSKAMADARAVMEGIRQTSVIGLAEVTAVNWTAWASSEGLDDLTEEAISVTYADPNADPLEVTIQVDWVEKERPRSALLETLVTQR